MVEITINVKDRIYEQLSKMNMEDRGAFVTNAIDVTNNIINVSRINTKNINVYKVLVNVIHDMILNEPNFNGKYSYKVICERVARILGENNDLSFSVRLSSYMRDLNLKTKSSTGNYRVLYTNAHRDILDNLYKLYVTNKEV